MKQLTLITTIIIISILQCFCINNTKVNNSFTPPPTTTLDSLQGKWTSAYDSSDILTINGRSLDELYTVGDYPKHIHYTIYFSDTLVDGMDFDFNQLKIDTSLRKGKYLLKAEDYPDLTVWCYEINGFDYEGSTITFSISDTWANRVPSIYQKN
jgi:hypothetical protein